MSENKTGKYFKYAIGEIILVVIGILIALQINNWNEHKQSSFQLRTQLISIQEDLNNDLKLLNHNFDIYRNASDSGDRLWVLINSDEPIKADIQTKVDFIDAGNLPTYSIVTTAYDDLISSSNINLIDNKKLKTRLANYYNQSLLKGFNLDQRIRYTNDYYDARYLHMSPYMLTNRLKERFRIDTLNIKSLDSFQLDWNAIKKDDAYKLALSKVISQRVGEENTINLSIKLAKGLKQEIESYLSNLK